jgi:hypothetical protein
LILSSRDRRNWKFLLNCEVGGGGRSVSVMGESRFPASAQVASSSGAKNFSQRPGETVVPSNYTWPGPKDSSIWSNARTLFVSKVVLGDSIIFQS